MQMKVKKRLNSPQSVDAVYDFREVLLVVEISEFKDEALDVNELNEHCIRILFYLW